MKKIILVCAALLALLAMNACGTRDKTGYADTTLILRADSCPTGGYIRLRNIMAIWVDSAGCVYTNHDLDNILPPPPPGEENYVYEDDRVLCDLSQLGEQVKVFISNPDNNPELSEKIVKDIPMIGDYAISKGIVSLHIMEGAPEESVDKVLKLIAASFIDLRDALSLEAFGLHYGELDAARASAIKRAIPTSAINADSMRFYRAEVIARQ